MNLEILKRNIKLQELGIGKLSNKEKQILDSLNEKLGNLNTYISDEYLGGLLFGKGKDNIVLEYNKENEFLYVDYDKIWSIFKDKFNIEDSDIRELIQWWVVDTLDLKVNSTYGYAMDFSNFVVDTLW